MKTPAAFGALAAAVVTAMILAGCSSDSSDSSADPAPATDATASAAETTASDDAVPAERTGVIDDIVIEIAADDEVSPGTLQYSGVEMDATISWAALVDGGPYGEDQCVTTVTVTDPGGAQVHSERDPVCAGETDLTFRSYRQDAGDYLVTVSLAPWNDPDAPTVRSTTVVLLADDS